MTINQLLRRHCCHFLEWKQEPIATDCMKKSHCRVLLQRTGSPSPTQRECMNVLVPIKRVVDYNVKV
ncbi:hypothetical protein N5D41_25825, partial [Pseudomonas toyotomiensis]